MRIFTLSLITVTLSAAIGLGYLLDYSYLNIQQPQQENIQINQQQSFLFELAKQLKPDSQLQAPLSLAYNNLTELALPAELTAHIKTGEPLFLQSSQQITLYWLTDHRQPDHMMSLNYQLPEQNLTMPTTDYRLWFTLIFYTGIALLVIGWSAPLIRRLFIIQAALHRFGNGELKQRIPNSHFSYIKNIEMGYNQMAQRIETLLEDNKLLSSAVSHDLRTPIARLRFGLDWLEEKLENDVDILQHIQRLSQDLDEMSNLVETLLKFARLEQQQIELKPRAYAIKQQVNHIIDALKQQYPDKAFELNIDDQAIIQVDHTYFSMLLNNLISNACRYGQTHIQISFVQHKLNWQLHICDDGQGIAPDIRDKVLLPFFRQANSQGYGMGLAIVTKIAQWHKLKLHLDASPMGGLQVIIQADSSS
ncbi:ATP-binding protein [Algibacillus agarilyticus]|uniref:ATP-binding protein n=1 Tax=Algibacillus agarilyticus TaxID=2234133 RepID=UPI000DD07CE4|nr:ATP-binding protein [Algibacillus agarilyticus]